MNNSHKWEDMSYHGSPDYQCMYCGCWEWDKQADMYCSKADECLEKERIQKHDAEFWEYKQLKTQHDRWEYLKQKFEV